MTVIIDKVTNNWVMFPAPWLIGAVPTVQDQKWLMTLTGEADINFTGSSDLNWKHETFRLYLDWASPVTWAYAKPVPANHYLCFKPEQWTQFATINSILHKNSSANAGFAVDSCKPYIEGDGYYYGIDILVGVQGKAATLYKVGFHVTVLGKIVLE